MNEQPPQHPDSSSDDSPYGSPPPPPSDNPYAPPPADTTPLPAYGTPPPAAPPPTTPPSYPQQPAYSPPPPPGYQAPTYAAPGYPAGATSPGHGGLAITGLVFSIVALVLCWIPFLGIVLAAVGLILGIAAWAGAGKRNRPKGMGIAATITSIVALLGALFFTVAILWVWDKAGHCFDPDLTQNQTDRCLENVQY